MNALRMLCLAACVLLSLPLTAQGWVDRSALNGPPAMTGHSMCWDPIRGYILLVRPNYQNGTLETWSWDGVTWTARGSHSVPWSPMPFGGNLVYQANSNQMCFISCAQTWSNVAFTCHATAWDGTSWATLASSTFAYGTGNYYPRCAVAYHASRNESVVIHNASTSTLIAFDGINFVQRPAINPHGLAVGPANITDYTYYAATDPSTGRVVATSTSTSNSTVYFEWNGLSWNQRLPSPLGRSGPLVEDTAHQCLVMFDTSLSVVPNHTWTYANGVMNRFNLTLEPTLRTGAAMAFDPIRGVSVLFGGANLNGSLLADTWEFDVGPLASFTPYGAGCVGSRGVPSLAAQGSSLPRIGSTFTAIANNLPWTGPAFVVLGVSNSAYGGTPLPIDLGFLGAPSCMLRTSIDDIQPLANILGAATWNWAIPPVAGASFYAQVLPIDPTANALAITASNACHGVIGL